MNGLDTTFGILVTGFSQHPITIRLSSKGWRCSKIKRCGPCKNQIWSMGAIEQDNKLATLQTKEKSSKNAGETNIEETCSNPLPVCRCMCTWTPPQDKTTQNPEMVMSFHLLQNSCETFPDVRGPLCLSSCEYCRVQSLLVADYICLFLLDQIPCKRIWSFHMWVGRVIFEHCISYQMIFHNLFWLGWSSPWWHCMFIQL